VLIQYKSVHLIFIKIMKITQITKIRCYQIAIFIKNTHPE